MAQSTLVEKFKNIGPGALVAAGFIGPGTVTTCTVSGANYGYTMLWALLFATVATIIFQEMAARIGIISQKGLGEKIRERIVNPALRWVAIVIVIVAIFVGNVAYETGNVTGGILGLQSFAPDLPMLPIVALIGLAGFACLWIGSYQLVEKILTAIVVFMGAVFFITAFASPVDWGAVVSGLFVPTLPSTEQTGGTSPILVAAGLIGTTVVPYNLFLHASGAAERFKDPDQVADARFDAALSIGLGGIISMAILVCAAANIYGTGVAVTNGKDMAIALEPLLGGWATYMIGLGLLAAGFSSVITASLSAAYAVNGVLGWGKGLKDLPFKAVWLIVLLGGCFMAVAFGKSPTQLILTAQAANAILLPVMAFFVMLCANGPELQKWRNHAFANAAGVIIIAVTIFIAYRNMSSFIASVQKLLGA
ncbi:Nramp family divalent metal transporter [Eggerthellaceae bacterium zg-1084]|uniref:Nramp family divalent metal transporter n=1 Tax=Berryella wangjianweii TaxID=2734634 RepID=A0A6M8JAH0_9ACTN|nr:Nramp family divalent metal transporter [Berryella wangjianweii]NPD31553.1 Nramp family divalent metal transporter [Berryella wangjianweii]NPD32952.1 Nramp family divalent metal transporter [Eggerthellaceae bacterium zg-997]QKF07822.1 Nramp family divalent metal transporter [Berryella wangjianweii]